MLLATVSTTVLRLWNLHT